MLSRLLDHPRILPRFLTLLALAVAIFVAAWAVAFYLLPEGILRGRTIASVLAGSEGAATFTAEFLRIAGLNLGSMALFVVLPNRLTRVGRYPLGYVPPMLWAALYAITLGTNSFSIPLTERMAPSFGVLGRSGVYEIASYVLMAVSTHAISLSRTPRLFSFRSEPIVPRPGPFHKVHWGGVAVALLVLLAANAREAYMIVSLAGQL